MAYFDEHIQYQYAIGGGKVRALGILKGVPNINKIAGRFQSEEMLRD
jgi:hypothetical protein